MLWPVLKVFMENELKNIFLSNTVNQIQDDDPEWLIIVKIGPPTGLQDSDLENENDEILNATGLPAEMTGEVKVFNIRRMKLRKWLLMVEIAMWNYQRRRNKNKMLKNPR